jgi:hypothetical protein
MDLFGWKKLLKNWKRNIRLNNRKDEGKPLISPGFKKKFFGDSKGLTPLSREILTGKAQFRFVEKGFQKGEDVYSAFGRTHSGRLLAVFFLYTRKINGHLFFLPEI